MVRQAERAAHAICCTDGALDRATRVVFEILIHARRRYDAAADAAEATATNGAGLPIRRQSTTNIFTLILIKTTSKIDGLWHVVANTSLLNLLQLEHGALVILVHRVEARGRALDRKHSERLALGYLVIHTRHIQMSVAGLHPIRIIRINLLLPILVKSAPKAGVVIAIGQ